MDAVLAGIDPASLAVAVSGGGDSMALLHLLAARDTGIRAVTVDHGLRAESAAEAAMVAEVCAGLGIEHTTLCWHDHEHGGNLQARARAARLRLMSGWAAGAGVRHIALAHTQDDQAETVLLRLMRGSGVDGLSGMAAMRRDGAVTWLRPLLGVRRAALRDYLRARAVGWVEDPSNRDRHYARVRVREAIGELGLDVARLSATADHMRAARMVLEEKAVAVARDCVQVSDAGEVTIDAAGFAAAPEESRFRAMAGILRWVSGAPYRPRLESLRDVIATLETARGRTLHGCVIRSRSGKVLVRREVSKVQGPVPVAAGIWDGRWRVVAGRGAVAADRIAALGVAGLDACEDWRATGHAREVLLATPALWSGGRPVAAPMAGMANGWGCSLVDGEKGLHKTLMTR